MQWQGEVKGMTVTVQDVRAAARQDAATVVGRQVENGWDVSQIINHHDIVAEELREAVTEQGRAYAEEYALAAVQLIGEMEREPEPQPLPQLNPFPGRRPQAAAELPDGTSHPDLPGWQVRNGSYRKAGAEQDQRQPA